MNIILFDDDTSNKLLPLTFTKPVSEIRIGILTVKEKWETISNCVVSYLTHEYLNQKFKTTKSTTLDNYFINSKIIPNNDFFKEVQKLKPGKGLKQDKTLLAVNAGKDDSNLKDFIKNAETYKEPVLQINNLCDIFVKNGEALQLDFDLLTKKQKSAALEDSVTVIGKKSLIFLEKGAKAEGCVFNTTNGPIYIGKNAEVMEGALVRGPFALGEESVLKMGAKIYGPTTVGPHCKVGGEVNNSVIFGYSNKAHDGFLGNSVIGEWCNLGADTNTSNLKNNYGNVKLFSYVSNKNEDTGLQFCGLIMGDHSKSGINTMFNTGTVVGVGSNVFGAGFPPTHIPSFSWGGKDGLETHRINKMTETAERVFARREMTLEDVDRKILSKIFKETIHQRKDKS